MLIGGALVVTDDGDVHNLGSATKSLDDLMMELGRRPGAERSDAYAPEGEGLAPLTDLDPDEAVGLAVWAQKRRLERGED